MSDHGAAEKGAAHQQQPTYTGTQNGTASELGRQISVTLTPAQFEELYLQPGVRSRSQAQVVKTFGNPTPLGIFAFLSVFTPTAACLMGWGGTDTNSLLALLGCYYLLGGLGLFVAGLLEWVLGNTFPFLVFTSFGGFWWSLAIFIDPNYAIATTLGATTAVYNSAFGFYLAFWAVFVLFLTLAALKTNLVLTWILFFVMLAFATLSAGYFKLGEGAVSTASNLITAAGATGFAACCGGWYLLLHLCLASVEYPFNVPLFDLSQMWAKSRGV